MLQLDTYSKWVEFKLLLSFHFHRVFKWIFELIKFFNEFSNVLIFLINFQVFKLIGSSFRPYWIHIKFSSLSGFCRVFDFWLQFNKKRLDGIIFFLPKFIFFLVKITINFRNIMISIKNFFNQLNNMLIFLFMHIFTNAFYFCYK